MRLSELKKYNESLYDKALSYSKSTVMELFSSEEKNADEYVEYIIKDDKHLSGCFCFITTEEGSDFWHELNDKNSSDELS